MCSSDLIRLVPEQALGESRRMHNVLSYAHMKEIEYMEKGEKKIIHYAEIGKAEEKQSKKGAAMIEVVLKAVDFGGLYLCHDRIMLAGPGAGIGSYKLFALGYGEGEDFQTAELVGKRVYVDCVTESYNGVERLKVSIDDGTSCCGYWPEREAPEAVVKPEVDDLGYPVGGDDSFDPEDPGF